MFWVPCNYINEIHCFTMHSRPSGVSNSIPICFRLRRPSCSGEKRIFRRIPEKREKLSQDGMREKAGWETFSSWTTPLLRRGIHYIWYIEAFVQYLQKKKTRGCQGIEGKTRPIPEVEPFTIFRRTKKKNRYDIKHSIVYMVSGWGLQMLRLLHNVPQRQA